MKASKTLFYLSLLVALLAMVYAGVGLFSQAGDGPFTFTNLHGETVEIYGRGIYRNDSTFRALVFRGTDAITLFVCVPALVIAAVLTRRGSLRGHVFLTSILGYFLYNSASLAFAAAYNNLLLAYIGAFSVSLFAFIIAFQSVDLPTLDARTSANFPHRWVAIFLFVGGLSVMVWLMDILGALSQGTVPAHLAHYHTEATYPLDLGIIPPAAFLAGVLVWQRKPVGTLLGCVMIMLNATVGLVVGSQSIMQLLDGIVLTPGEYVAYVAPFVSMSFIAIGLLISIFRNISEGEESHAKARSALGLV